MMRRRPRGGAVSAWMAGRVSETMLADAQLLVVELVANSVRHADAPADGVVSVRPHVRADVLCLELEDRGSIGSIARWAPDLQHRGGLGLNVVEMLSERWGVSRDAGTRVWAELAFRQRAEKPATDRESAMQPDTNERSDARNDAASAAQTRANTARERALAAREAAEQATTEYARRGHDRVADT
jgi:serine/threonine-protein kinase RsbW